MARTFKHCIKYKSIIQTIYKDYSTIIELNPAHISNIYEANIDTQKGNIYVDGEELTIRKGSSYLKGCRY